MNRTLLVLVFMLLVAGGVFAYDLNGCQEVSDFNAIGDCVIRGAFSEDPYFFALIFMAIFAGLLYQARAPGGAAIGIVLIVTFALMPMLNPGDYQFLLGLVITIIGILIGLAIVKVRR